MARVMSEAGQSSQETFIVAALRITPKPWDKQGNLALLDTGVRQAASQGAEVVVTPEGFVEGYPWNDDNMEPFSRERYFDIGEPLDGPAMAQVGRLARQTEVYVVVGFAERRGDQMYNSVATISPQGTLISVYAKAHTAGDDEPLNTKGGDLPVVDTPLGTWGTLICMDRQLPEAARVLALRGAQVILVPASGMHGEINDVMMRTRAYENGVHVVFVHPERCMVIDPDGEVIAEDRGPGDQLVMARVHLLAARSYGPIRCRRPELYGMLSRHPVNGINTRI